MARISIFLTIAALIAGMIGCVGGDGNNGGESYTLIIDFTAGGTVTVDSLPIPGKAILTYEIGTVVSVSASASTGYRFVEWTGNVSTVDDVNAASTTITMNGDYSITADFEVTSKCNLTISCTTGGSVAAPGEGVFAYDKGKRLALAAIPVDGCRFVNWIGDVDTIGDVEDATTTIIVNKDYSITAKFKEDEVVTFLDVNLEAAVRQAIAKPEGSIYARDMEQLGVLFAEQSRISDLTGLEYATRLIGLELSGNQISDISPLANLTGLAFLNLDSNQISDISPLANFTKLACLRMLSLSGNRIGDISPLANLTTLKSLDIRDNQISDISSLTDHRNLVGLSLGGNQIRDISPLTNLTGLAFLGLDSNQITDISPLANHTGLPDLRLSNDQISDISPLANLTNLGYLNLGYNQISDISPLVHNDGLSEGDTVRLQSNPLSSDSVNIYIPQLRARGVTVIY